MKLKISALLTLLLSVLFFAGFYGCTAAAKKSAKEAPRMLLVELKAHLDDTSVVIIDVRASNDWKGSSVKIKGAIREKDYKNASSWASKYEKDKTIVLYCA